MSIEMKKVWFDGKKMVTQNIPESDIYKRHWDIASCKAYAEQLRDKNRANTAEHAAEAIEYLLTLAQPKQEPVAWMDDYNACKCSDNETRCFSDRVFRMMQKYTTPPQREWVGLTDEEQQQAYEQWQNEGWGVFYNAIEARLKDKNI